ncbi:acyl-CoA carboxylase subunit beta [Bdellovibrionota bacterium FG-1]
METTHDLNQQLLALRQQARQMGGPEAIQKQHEAGKLTARERIQLLFDEGSFVEYGVLGTHHSALPDMKDKITPADGVVTGVGMIQGRPAAVAAYDFTVMAGTMGEVGERKVKRMRETSLRERMPMIWLLDSAGARIQEAAGAQFAATGSLFFDQVQMSGVVPQVAAVMGPTAAGTAYIPALADFVPMVKGTSSMALAGPPLVKAAINEDVTTEDLGGTSVHCRISGVADLETANDPECITAIRKYLAFFPSHSKQKPPRIEGAIARHSKFSKGIRQKDAEGATKAFDRLAMSDAILGILPEDSRKAYDMKDIIRQIVDKQDDAQNNSETSTFFEIKPDFARNIITGLARIDSWSVGILANQPQFMGGAIDVDASDKAARFLWLCDAYNIPVVFLHDCPGFMVGSRMEKMGIIRHGAKMLFALSEMTVPKFSIVIRRSYGAGYYVMCGKGYEPDLIVGWPTAEVSLMSPEGAVNIIFRKEIAAAPNPEQARAARTEQYRHMIGGHISASQGHLDDIIDPRETRKILATALLHTRAKKVTRPAKKHGVLPV